MRVSLDERVSSEIVRGIREGAADFGVCWDAGDLAGLQMLPYRSDHLCAIVPSSHPLARRKKVAFVDTLAYDQIEILAGSIVQITLKRTAAMAGKELRQRIQVTTFDAACRNVAAGLGIAIVPRESAEPYAQALGLRILSLSDPWSVRRFVICMRSRESLSAAAGPLVDYLPERARQDGKHLP